MQLANRGAAMLAALLFLVVASGIITLMFTSTLSEIRHTGDDVAIVQALTLARGGMNMGGRLLQDAVRDELQLLTLDKASTVERFPFGSSPNISDPEPTAASVINDLKQVTEPLQARIDALLCSTSLRPANAQMVSVRIYVTDTACGDTLPSRVKLPAARYVSNQNRTYAIPFVLVAEAQIGSSFKRTIASQGEYQFTVGGGKFSQYALFTDEHVGVGGGPVWFTDMTSYDGRVHTNTTFRIAFDPWFGDKVTSAGCEQTTRVIGTDGKWTTECTQWRPGATFYSEGTFRDEVDIGDPPIVGNDSPQFTQGVDWRADYIPLPEDNLDLDEKAKGIDPLDPNAFLPKRGLYFGGSLDSLTLYAGDDNGNPLSSDGNGGWTPQASYQYIEACRASCELYRYGPDNRLYKQNTDGSWPDPTIPDTEYIKVFNGLIYVEGNVSRFKGPDRVPANSSDTSDSPPAIAGFAKMTVVPTGDIRFTGDLKYENPPCEGILTRVGNTVTRPPCNNLDTKNILGIFTPGGDIIVGNKNSDTTTNAPDNIEIHGSFMTADGGFITENLYSGNDDPRGDINVLGGVIEQRYGATGQFYRSGARADGYNINITFDQRMALNYSPPFFPGTSPNDVQDVFVYSFGQREQVF